jgi:hypothetical protein
MGKGRPHLSLKELLGGEYEPTGAQNREAERSNSLTGSLIWSIMGAGTTRKPGERRIVQKANAWGNAQDKLTWTLLYGRERTKYDGRKESTQAPEHL